MAQKMNRRRAGKCLIGAALTFEHGPLVAKLKGAAAPASESSGGALPVARIGKLSVTRLICGGNLFSGFAHSGNLVYVSSLLKHYFTDEKVLETLQVCEENGINSAILRTDDNMVRILKRYRKERGGKIQWIAQTYPKPDDLFTNIKLAIDNGAVGAFPMGGNAEALWKAGRVDAIAEVVSFMKRNGLTAGVGSHVLEIPKVCERQKVNPDFYFKTINGAGYETEEPAEIASYMKSVKKPWIGFKVLGAGRAKPEDGFSLAFKSGADFINVGMYDFQVKQDVSLVKRVVAASTQRERPWIA
jgi:hypothetical protein